jgi:glycerophosphoryl diester phosphodiesterase
VVAQAIGNIFKLDGDAVSAATGMTTPSFILSARAAEKEVHVWTINERNQMHRFIDLGVDNIITDEPALLAGLLEERAAMSDEERFANKVRNSFRR